jgi:hypothetical protein
MKYILLIFSGMLFLGCTESEKKIQQSFFVAGHAYGKPAPTGEKELYPPFKEKFSFLNSKNLSFGVLLGDVVRYPSSWPNVLKELEDLTMPYYIARGNHDGPLDNFEDMFGKSYQKFVQDNNLFIILDPNIDQWNISGDQLVFLKETLQYEGQNADHIFIFMHQLIWWSKEKFSEPKPNWQQNRAETPNYWSTIQPILESIGKEVYLFAGDVGAFSKEYKKKDHIIEYAYFKENNITYIATGMGGGVRDNIVIVDIYEDKSVKLNLIHLNGDNINSLGKLKY